MSYVSPIKIGYAEEPEEGWTDKIGRYMAGEVDNLVLQSCVKVGCHVDKDELEKALRYDRDQYVKGYEDGKRDAAPRWHRVEEPPKEYGTYIVCWKDGEKFWWEKADWDEDWCTNEPNWYSFRDSRATIINPDYWMPIEPPKGDA